MLCESVRLQGQWGEIFIGLGKVLGLGDIAKRRERGSQEVRVCVCVESLRRRGKSTVKIKAFIHSYHTNPTLAHEG